jgi:hypothetical protein
VNAALRLIAAGLVAFALAGGGCVHPAESRTLSPPPAGQPDLARYILEHYQADVDRAFEAVEAKGMGTFARLRLDLKVAEDGRVSDASAAISENYNCLLLARLRPSMESWRLPATGQAYSQTVELVRSHESLARRRKDIRIAP